MKPHYVQPLALFAHFSNIFSASVRESANYNDIKIALEVLLNPLLVTNRGLAYNAWRVVGPVVDGVKIGGIGNRKPPNKYVSSYASSSRIFLSVHKPSPSPKFLFLPLTLETLAW